MCVCVCVCVCLCVLLLYSTLAGGTQCCPGHYIKVIECIMQRYSWVRGKVAR
jgi:hypothetical protein